MGTTRDEYVGLLPPLDDLVRRDGQRRRSQSPVRMSHSLLWATVWDSQTVVYTSVEISGDGRGMPSLLTTLQVDNTCIVCQTYVPNRDHAARHLRRSRVAGLF
eukprot:7481452-Pyramimonas_sp.AAC.1